MLWSPVVLKTSVQRALAGGEVVAAEQPARSRPDGGSERQRPARRHRSRLLGAHGKAHGDRRAAAAPGQAASRTGQGGFDRHRETKLRPARRGPGARAQSGARRSSACLAPCPAPGTRPHQLPRLAQIVAVALQRSPLDLLRATALIASLPARSGIFFSTQNEPLGPRVLAVPLKAVLELSLIFTFHFTPLRFWSTSNSTSTPPVVGLDP